MQVLNVVQGSDEWLAIRTQYDTASEAPVMMGASKYQTRSDLMRQKANGYVPEVSAEQQRLFDRGHAAEAAARIIVEQIINEDLYPITATDGGRLLASFDGVNLDETIGFEHKLWSESLAAQVRSGELEPHYFWQLEHQLLVGGFEKIIFVCSDGTRHKFEFMDYRAVPGRAKQLIDGWKQFWSDMAEYKPTEVQTTAVATVQPSLPAVVVRMGGALTVDSNLPDFALALRAYIDRIPAKPNSDQEFADAEAACTALKKAEDALEQAENGALSQMSDVEQMRRLVSDLRTLARTTRLATEKVVKARKDSIRTEIYQEGLTAYQEHVAALNKRIGKPYMPPLPVDFAGAIKGKKTVASLRDAVATNLATAKIAANEVADRIQVNLATLIELASDHRALFPDTAQIVLKANDDLTALVKTRIAEHERAEAARLERERARIAEEERVKAEAKVRAEVAAEAKRVEAAEQAWIQSESRAKEAADVMSLLELTATPAPVQAPASMVDSALEQIVGVAKEAAARHAAVPTDLQLIECAVIAVANYFGMSRAGAWERLADIQEWDSMCITRRG